MNLIQVHPVYINYGYCADDDQIYFISKNRIVKQRPQNCGYSYVSFRYAGKQKTICAHRFIWECCKYIIPNGYEIDHINRNKTYNTISNLQCITMQENRKRRDHTNIIINASRAHKLVRFIKAIKIDTNEFNCFKSKNQCGRYYGVSASLIYLIVEHKNRVKTANTNMGRFRFEYIDDNDVENLIIIPHGNIENLCKV